LEALMRGVTNQLVLRLWASFLPLIVMALPVPANAADMMRMTVTGLVSGFGDYFVAADRGYFAEENIDAQILQAGGNTATPALLSGDVQYSTSASIAISAILRGGELRIVYVNNDRVPYQLWTTVPAIQSLADLKGKQVGVETRGDTHELAMRQAFVAANVDPSTVVFTPLANRSAIVASLMTGALAGASMVTDEVERLKSVPNARLLFDLQAIHLIAGGGVFSESLLKENRPLAKRFMRAVIKGHRRGQAVPDDVIASVRKRNASLSSEEIRAAMQAQRPLNTKDGTISPEQQAQEITNRSAVLGIPPEKRRRPEEMFDFSLLKEVNAELDTQGWKP
jgi:ABC-type nitrate/sulfonate/bicarbonate transport system substrate-binding protein